MRKTLVSMAVLSVLASAAHAADAPASPHTIAYNVGLSSEYSYRGVSQSERLPALSGGADYSHSSGVYLGVWASGIRWLKEGGTYEKSDAEVDVYGGYKAEVAKDTTVDVGVLQYVYPGTAVTGATKADTTEVYVAGTYKFATLKYSYVVSSDTFGYADSKGSSYADLSVNYDVAEGTQLNLHWGYQKIAGDVSGVSNDQYSYSDYKVGVTKDFGFAAVSIAYVGTNYKDAAGNQPDNAKGRGVVSITKTF